MSYIFFAWVASLSSALVVVVSKLTSKHSIKNPWLFNFLWSLVVLILTLPLPFINNATFPHNWLPIILTGVFSALFYIFYTLSIYRLDVSTISPLFNFRTLFAVLLGLLFLSEQFTSYQLMLAMGIIIAGIFATIDEKFSIQSFFNSSVGIALIAMVFLALRDATTKWASIYDDVWTVNLWVNVVGIIVILPTINFFKNDFKKINIRQLRPLALMSFFQLITNFSLTTALAVNVGITSIIMSIPFSMILAVLFSTFAPKLLEKHSLKIYAIRFAAAIIMIYGALQLSK